MNTLGDLREVTEKTTSALEWLAEVLQGQNWVRKLALAFVTAGILLNPRTLGFLSDDIAFPEWYNLAYGLVLAGLFGAALVAANRYKKRAKAAATAIDIAKMRSPIKVLRPWAYEDAALFSRMQRENELRSCVETITAPDFRFGMLIGESGCGKSSFLQAGVWPRLEQQATSHHCLYVKLTEEDPVDTLRRVIEERFKLPHAALTSADFMMLLEQVVTAKGATVVVLLDQFEQFFVHRKSAEQRAPFLNAMAQWYTHKPPLPVKILVCFRADLFHWSLELQKAMGYALGPQELFELKKLTPGQATEVFRVMAEVEGLDFDPSFVKDMARDELASREDGLVSPVDLQILAWMMTGQAEGERAAFDRASYQRLGGVEGLLERFLKCALRARETEARRQAAVKVMLALTDIERNARAGVLSVADVKNKVGSTLTETEVEDAIAWLARNGLVTPQNRSGRQGYELAHERLIPALRRLAGKSLTEADQVNQLLDRRVHEWLGNECMPRYLLRWGELRRIRRQMPYLVWGTNERHKRELLERSWRLWLRRGGAVAAFVLLVGSGAGLWISPIGQIWQVKQDLAELAEKQLKPEVLIRISKYYQADGSKSQADAIFERALRSVGEIAEPESRVNALISVVEVAATRGDGQLVAELLEKARQSSESISDLLFRVATLKSVITAATNRIGDAGRAAALLEKSQRSAQAINDPWFRIDALLAVADADDKLGNSTLATALLDSARQSAETIDDPLFKADALIAVAEAAERRGDSEQALALLESAARSTEMIAEPDLKDYALIALAEAAARRGDTVQAAALLERARQFGEAITRPEYQATLKAVVGAEIKRGNAREVAALLERARQSAETITEPESKAEALKVVVEAAAQRGDTRQIEALLDRAGHSAEAIGEPKSKAGALKAVVEAATQRGDSVLLEKARRFAEAITDPQFKADALISVVEVKARLGDTAQAAELLEKARRSAEAITDPALRSNALITVAEAKARFGDPDQAVELLDNARQSTEAITDATQKELTLREVVKALSRRGYLLAARHTASIISTHNEKANACIDILDGWKEWKLTGGHDAGQLR